MKKINLGCGNDIRKGFINVDIFEENADILHDLNIFPYPFEDNSIDYLVIKDVLEHLMYPELVLKEIIRILKPKARAFIQVPHYTHEANYMNIGHRFHFHENALDICLRQSNSDSSMPSGFKIISKKVKRNRFRIWKKQSIRWVIEKVDCKDKNPSL